MKQNLIVTDVETGGYFADKNPITQLALSVVNPNTFEVIHSYQNFCKPYNNLVIEADAIAASRVSMQQIKAGVTIQVIVRDFIAACKKANRSGHAASRPIVVGHNIGFDFTFLVYAFSYCNKDLFDYVTRNHIDTLTQSKMLMGDSMKSDENNRFSLTMCCERFGITLHNAHGAKADVEATTKLIQFLTKTSRQGYAGNTVKSTVHGSSARKTRDGFHFEI